MAGGRWPTFLIIGVPKAGTAALSWALGQQPGVFSHPSKEVHFFDDNHGLGSDWYRAQFEDAGDAPIVGEATPNYALRDEWVRSAADLLPDARIILQVRHPVDRLWSSYWFLFQALALETRTLEEVVEQETGDHPPADDRVKHVRAGWYDEIYARLVGGWDEDQVLVIEADQLHREPEQTVVEAAHHVGVQDPVPVRPGTGHNRMTMPRSQLLHRLLVAGRRRGLVKPRSRTARAWLWFNDAGQRPPPLDPGLRQRLLDHYEPHTQRFEAMIGREFPHWRS